MLTDSIAIMIKRANIEIDRNANQLLAPYGLTHSQFKVLKFLLMHKGENVRQIDLEQFFYMTNPTVTGMLQTLEKKGLVTRTVNPEDKRSKLIMLTDKTIGMEKELFRIGPQLDDRIAEALNEEQKEEIKKLLHIMLQKYE